VKTDYDATAGSYEQHAADSPYNAHYDRPAVLELMGDVAGMRVLDAWCSPGLYSEEIFERGADVVAVDRSATMVEPAQKRPNCLRTRDAPQGIGD